MKYKYRKVPYAELYVLNKKILEITSNHYLTNKILIHWKKKNQQQMFSLAVPEWLAIWSNIILDVSVKVFLFCFVLKVFLDQNNT